MIYKIHDIIREAVQRTSTKLLLQLQEADKQINDATVSKITGINFEYGHINDIREAIARKLKAGENPAPFVCLIEDYKVRRGQKAGTTGVTNMKILILYYSRADVTRQWRDEFVFDPYLIPIYLEFLTQLKLGGKFQIYDESKISHDMILRPHWGDPGLYGNTQYPLNGIFDGIELSDLQLSTYLQICV